MHSSEIKEELTDSAIGTTAGRYSRTLRTVVVKVKFVSLFLFLLHGSGLEGVDVFRNKDLIRYGYNTSMQSLFTFALLFPSLSTP